MDDEKFKELMDILDYKCPAYDRDIVKSYNFTIEQCNAIIERIIEKDKAVSELCTNIRSVYF